MAADTKSVALDACDEALKISIGNISSVLLNALASAKSDHDRTDAADRARKGVQISKDAHTVMKGIVEAVF